MKRFCSERRGATIVEFAIILPVLCALLAAGLEFAYRTYLNAIVQGALLEAARSASIGNKTSDQIDEIIKTRVAMLSNRLNVKNISKSSFYDFSRVGKPEKITSDTDPQGVYNSTDCYEDANNNSTYDSSPQAGLGTADDIVKYEVTVTYPNIMPMNTLLGWGTSQTIIASTALRNQPFTSRAAPTIRCP